ncbi:hypothetical protein BaRGS_00011479 [Batillaria attramentaria]|uniref:Ig-like domain-containing protein n=1 Tax=Batillaria attramentaria TaxID=370345 RepID=A0ABD0LD04_9CAEN
MQQSGREKWKCDAKSCPKSDKVQAWFTGDRVLNQEDTTSLTAGWSVQVHCSVTGKSSSSSSDACPWRSENLSKVSQHLRDDDAPRFHQCRTTLDVGQQIVPQPLDADQVNVEGRRALSSRRRLDEGKSQAGCFLLL